MLPANKEKKIKPLKQPSKAHRNLLSASKKPEELMMKASEPIAKSKMPNSSNNKPEERKLDTIPNVCTELLETGNVQSFIDLFYISHKCLPNVMETRNYFGENLHVPE